MNLIKKYKENKEKKLKQQMVSVFNEMKHGVSETSIDDIEQSKNAVFKAAQTAKELEQANLMVNLGLRYNFYKRVQSSVIPSGFTKYLDWNQIGEALEKLDEENVRNVLATTLDEYPRPIPSENAKAIEKAKDVFDEIAIIYTDYTGKERKSVSEARKEKDPIAFGILVDKFINPITKREEKVSHAQAFFITDWVDENCDLTLDKLLEESKSVDMNLDVNDLPYNQEDMDEMFSSNITPQEDYQKLTSLFNKE